VRRLAYRILVGEPEGRVAMVRPRHKLEVKVKFRTGHEDPERQKTYGCTLSLTMALDWGG
jgi:hypothetical protein